MAGALVIIDPSTPEGVATLRRFKDGKELRLVMSDEFETDGRSFGKGADKLFEAIEKPDDTNQAIQFYNSSTDYVTTRGGSLVLSTKAVKTSWLQWDSDSLTPNKGTKNYTSGMVQTWNKFCFTGGVLEMSIRLPGKSDSGGLWPAAWLMGNLARATYDKSVQYMWPWSYDKCGEIRNLGGKQEINACDASPPSGMMPHQGRGAPEIDIFEVMPGHQMPGYDQPIRPFMSTSLQISPGIDSARRPINGHPLNHSSNSWYDVRIGAHGEYNEGFWGQECGPVVDDSPERVHKYMEDAISANTWLNASHFDSHHTYRLEWQPGAEGYLQWFLDGEFVFAIDGKSVAALTGAVIPVEPMYLILNTAISHRWGMPEPCDIEHCPMCWRCYDCANPDCQCTLPQGMRGCKNLPAEMEVDFIRLYQDADDASHTVGCSPDRYPTLRFIHDHPVRYEDWHAYDGIFAGISRPASYASVLALLLLAAATLLYFRRRVGRRVEYSQLLDNKVAFLYGGAAEEGLELKGVQLPYEPNSIFVQTLKERERAV